MMGWSIKLERDLKKSVSRVSDRRKSLRDKHFHEFIVDRAVRLGRARNKGIFETTIQQSGGVEKETRLLHFCSFGAVS